MRKFVAGSLLAGALAGCAHKKQAVNPTVQAMMKTIPKLEPKTKPSSKPKHPWKFPP